MPHSAHRNSRGAPTFTAASASLSLSGLDQFSSANPMDPNLLDGPNWYSHPGTAHHAPLSPHHDHYGINFVTGPSGFPSHSVAVSHEALPQPRYPALPHPMNGISHQFDGPPLHLDELSPISPIQTTYPPYGNPYPDSTASSAPSEEPMAAEADEDKRKRNQAASARFRQKKKQREQQMLEQSRQMQERTKKLETDVDNLRRENTFLKKLLVEKVDNMSDEDKALLAKVTGVDKSV